MEIKKSKGVTETEKKLADLCDRSFLKLWSYPNPINDEHKEFCDLLAVFENHVFIFFDRENRQLNKVENDPVVNWKRWKRNVIDPQIRTAIGAEKYLRKGRKLFLDSALSQPFPIPIDPSLVEIHKIIVAHGAKEACLRSSAENVSGSLAITYLDAEEQVPEFPFMINMNKKPVIHILDSHNLSIILGELDTFYDFHSYLNAKEVAISKFSMLTYCGEEDLLANYFANFDDETNQHYIGSKRTDIDILHIPEGEWNAFISSDIYKNKINADAISYFWDEIIQRTCANALNGTLLGNHNIFENRSALHEMAKEPRWMRRELSELMLKSIDGFPETDDKIMRNISLIPSFYEDKAYVFLQLKNVEIVDYEGEYRPKRQKMLEIACGAAKLKFDNLKTIIGISIDSPKFSTTNSEDFILIDCSKWTPVENDYYAKENLKFNFFNTRNLNVGRKTINEFPS